MTKIFRIFLCLTLLLTSLPCRCAPPSPPDLVAAFAVHKKQHKTFADINNKPLPDAFKFALFATQGSLNEPCASCGKTPGTPCKITQEGKRLPQKMLDILAQ